MIVKSQHFNNVKEIIRQAGQAVVETRLPDKPRGDMNMGLPRFFELTKKDSWLKSTFITLVQQTGSVSLSSKRLSLELTSVSLGAQTQGGNNIKKNKFW